MNLLEKVYLYIYFLTSFFVCFETGSVYPSLVWNSQSVGLGVVELKGLRRHAQLIRVSL